MDISTRVVRQVLELSDSEYFKNQCIQILDSYLYDEPQLTEEELRKSLITYLKGLDYDWLDKTDQAVYTVFIGSLVKGI